MPTSPCNGPSLCPASSCVCHLTSLPAVAAHLKHMQMLLTGSLALCWTMLSVLPPPGIIMHLPLCMLHLAGSQRLLSP